MHFDADDIARAYPSEISGGAERSATGCHPIPTMKSYSSTLRSSTMGPTVPARAASLMMLCFLTSTLARVGIPLRLLCPGQAAGPPLRGARFFRELFGPVWHPQETPSSIMRGGRTDAIMRVESLAPREEGKMSIFPSRVLLATDGSGEAELATRTAVDLARMSGSELHVVHVLDAPNPALLYPEYTSPEGAWTMPDYPLEEDFQRRWEQLGRAVLDAEAERVLSAGGTVAQAHLATGDAPREIVHLAEDLDAGLVVMGSRGLGGIRRALMGSVSDAVVRHAHCPVLIVRA